MTEHPEIAALTMSKTPEPSGSMWKLEAFFTEMPEGERRRAVEEPAAVLAEIYTRRNAPIPGWRMTFTTRGRTRAGGILGALEKWFTLRLLPRVYTDELALLAAEATR